ncbi:MAG: hypothetical protein QXD61_12045 [Candidatus Caldarchaeum sp.]
MDFPKIVDYLDADVAYFLGLLTARGTITEAGGVRRIAIEFPFRNLRVEGIRKKFVQRDQIILSLQDPIKRINELTDVQIGQHISKSSVYLTIETLKNTIFWRNVKSLMRGMTSYYEFSIPKEIFGADENIKTEFMRGYADVAGYARVSNRDQSGRHRIYLDVLNANWYLPVQICHLLQDHLRVPTQTINYGHPNLRDPQGKDFKAGRHGTWAREHQYKTYCEYFLKIGFYMKHKQEILEELAQYNIRKFGKKEPAYCQPPKPIRGGKNFKHPEVKSDTLPRSIRGKQYHSYWQICVDLGCPRYQRSMASQTKLW